MCVIVSKHIYTAYEGGADLGGRVSTFNDPCIVWVES